jgi:hypothetical protein
VNNIYKSFVTCFTGRFDEGVIIERMRSAQDLLNFVGQRHYMVNHEAFKHFFEVCSSSICSNVAVNWS